VLKCDGTRAETICRLSAKRTSLFKRAGASVQSTAGIRGVRISGSRLRLKCDGTRAETRFRLSAKRTSPFKSAGGVSSVDYWQASCAHQPAGFVLLVQACVLQSCDAYWLPTPASSFPFTSPPVRHRVPSHFNWTLMLDTPCLR